MEQTERAWLYLNEVGWFYDPDGNELKVSQARRRWRQGERVDFRAPTPTSAPMSIATEAELLEVFQKAVDESPNWV